MPEGPKSYNSELMPMPTLHRPTSSPLGALDGGAVEVGGPTGFLLCCVQDTAFGGRACRACLEP